MPADQTPSPALRNLRALAQLAAVATAAALAASAWAANAPAEEGYLLDGPLWAAEVAGAKNGHWPADGWFRVAQGEKSFDVRAADASRAATTSQDGAWFVRVPGTKLRTGTRPLYRMTAAVAQPRIGREYQLTLGRTVFGFTVDQADGALAYTVRYGGEDHVYRLAAAGTRTTVRAIADLDGDAQPDFVVDAGEETFLLLSSTAKAGHNEPTAQLWSARDR